MNIIFQGIQFNMKVKEDNQLPYLDVMVFPTDALLQQPFAQAQTNLFERAFAGISFHRYVEEAKRIETDTLQK